ncbi:hypothetical protein [Janthinobacterium fluminis]|uniref:Uncharacterized protein n=1 Tax=Janthinobacterium fluminis TaxID=2987524 RepID=A0ABT5JU35_9BURK|nr:hypothetical protein [Janthinobacterium fluminis]MDC8756242.1 hypothetical protein [Janthinobacterium fluminis]
MRTIAQSHTIKLPRINSRPYRLLQALLAGAGTFYQVCERAGLDIEQPGAEPLLRGLFEGMLATGVAKLDGILYSVTLRARLALEEPAVPACGQVAAPHFRGAAAAMPVLVVRA